MFVLPYKKASRSARELAEALGAKRIKLEGSRFKGSPNKTVINWGGSSVPAEVAKCRVLNAPDKVGIAANKRSFFRALKETEVSVPESTENYGEALSWIEEGKSVVCRTKLTGNSGEGIVLAEDVDELVEAPLYTKYVPKKFEYRVHVFGGEVLHVQRKARNTEVPDAQVDWRIRNHDNGFIFAFNEDHQPSPKVNEQALKAVAHLGLDFGAVDVIFNEGRDTAYVLEVNTACGLEGTTLDKYVEAFGKA